MARSPRIYCVSPPSYIYEAYAWQVREKELTHLRAGLLMTVVKWGKVDLFERVVEDKNFADQISPALVQQVYARHTLGVHEHRSSCLPPVESLTLTLTLARRRPRRPSNSRSSSRATRSSSTSRHAHT